MARIVPAQSSRERRLTPEQEAAHARSRRAIAMFCLIPFNYFQRRIEKLRFKLETQATNVEVMLEKLKSKTGYEA